MPTITQLEYILAVCENMHFGRAAKKCHVSQPSLSAQIQKVEEELDIIIFDRSKQPILLTDKGRLLVAQAKIVLHEHRKIAHLTQEQEKVSGDFHLGIIPTLAAYVLPIFIEEFSKKHPQVNLKISELKTEHCIEYLYDDKIDAALLVTPLYDDKIVERVLFFEPFYIFCSKEHKLYKRKVIKDCELEVDSVWLLEEGHCFRNQMMKICGFEKSVRSLENVTFESGNLETLINLVRKGHGYTLLPYLATLNLTNLEKKNNLKAFTRPIPTREVSLVHSRIFLKENIISAIQKSIADNIPKELISFQKRKVQIVDI